MPTQWYDGRITRIETVHADIRRFFLEVPQTERFDFQPGQFITMDLPIHEKRLHRWRSYSIASAPDGGNEIELCIVRLEGGRATRYLFEDVGVGSTIRFKGPGGTFVLPETIDKDIVMVCTGTGIAPFRSMLRHLARSGQPHRKVHLIFGTRFRSGVLYEEEWMALQREMPGFQYSVALSREEGPLDTLPFEARKGYVHAYYQEAWAGRGESVQFLLCGWSNMVDEARSRLVEEMGYSPAQVITELYG